MSSPLENLAIVGTMPQSVDLILPDINGIARGKRIPIAMLEKVLSNGISLPASMFAADITGDTVEATGLVWECGDADYPCFCLEHMLRPALWRRASAADLMLTMQGPENAGFYGEPRALAKRLLADLAALGLFPQVAFELEFYLLPRPEEETAQAPFLSNNGDIQVYDLDSIDAHEQFFSELSAATAAYDLPLEAVVSENAHGQFEVNLHYRCDALRAADDAWALKRLIKGVAGACGYTASFMAKPYPAEAGSGMHVHVSLVDREGHNAFTKQPELLEQALGGMLVTMPEAVALLAPHANSYRRFQVGSYAPTLACWGENNRTAALRIPRSEPEARRIEHRFGGADANPYLVLAAVLGGMLYGFQNKVSAPPAVAGNAYVSNKEGNVSQIILPSRWDQALSTLSQGQCLAPLLGAPFVKLFNAVKQHEFNKFQNAYHPLEYAWYFERS